MNISEEIFRKIMASKHMAYRTMLCCRIPEDLKATEVENVFRTLNSHFVSMAMVVDNFKKVQKVTKLRNDVEHVATKMIIGKKTKQNEYGPLPKRPQLTLWSQGLKKADKLTYEASACFFFLGQCWC